MGLFGQQTQRQAFGGLGLGQQQQAFGGLGPLGMGADLPASFFSRVGLDPVRKTAEPKVETFYSKLKTEITEWLKITV